MNRCCLPVLAACLLAAIIGWAHRRDDPLIQLALFALIAFIANAFLMANLSGVFGRYQARIAFLPIFAALALISGWARRLLRSKES